MGGLVAWFKGLTVLGKTGVVVGTLVAGTAVVPAPESPEVMSDTIEARTETETEEIDFKTVTRETSLLNDGETEIDTVGREGLRTLTYEVTYVNGVEDSRELISNKVTREPIDEVVLVGTYVAPEPQPSNCDPNYSGCVPIASDVDCAGGSGNGPAYVTGPVQVIGYDIYGLDGDNDGIGCQ